MEKVGERLLQFNSTSIYYTKILPHLSWRIISSMDDKNNI